MIAGKSEIAYIFQFFKNFVSYHLFLCVFFLY